MRIRSMSMTAPSTATSSECARSSATSTQNSIRSKPFMASDTATASPDREPGATRGRPRHSRTRGGRWTLGSRLGRLIILLNLLGLAILVGGALILNELRQGLVETRLESLELEGQVIAK